MGIGKIVAQLRKEFAHTVVNKKGRRVKIRRG